MTTGDVMVERPAPVVPRSRSAGDWRRDVALELWVDVAGDRAAVRLAGTLDPSTLTALAGLASELAAEGVRTVDLRADGLLLADPPARGVGS